MKARNFTQIWKKRSRRQFLFRVALVRPIQGGPSSSADVLVNSSVATSVIVEDSIQTKSLFLRVLESNQPALAQLDRSASMKARPEIEKLTDLVLTSKAFPGIFCRHLLSGESGFMREFVSWLTNHPNLSQALERWREIASEVEPDRHVQVKSGFASARNLVEMVESFLRVVREDLRSGEAL